jgi:hypothetical protein
MTFVARRYHVDGQDIMDLSNADGLKEALLNCGFTRNQILTYTIEELASILEIDRYVANIIRDAAKP